MNAKTLKSLSLPVIFVIVMAFTIGNKYVEEVTKGDLTKSQKKTSIHFENGSYRIDTNFIRRDINKPALLEILKNEKLCENYKVAEIPQFIKAFLDSTSQEKIFEMADPGEEWHAKDITYFASPSTSNCDMRRLPTRQLVYLGIGKNVALMTFYNGDLMIRYEAIILRFENEKIIDFWFTQGFPYVSTKEKIIEMLSTRSDGC
jgi:hypothetical protein